MINNTMEEWIYLFAKKSQNENCCLGSQNRFFQVLNITIIPKIPRIYAFGSLLVSILISKFLELFESDLVQFDFFLLILQDNQFLLLLYSAIIIFSVQVIYLLQPVLLLLFIVRFQLHNFALDLRDHFHRNDVLTALLELFFVLPDLLFNLFDLLILRHLLLMLSQYHFLILESFVCQDFTLLFDSGQLRFIVCILFEIQVILHGEQSFILLSSYFQKRASLIFELFQLYFQGLDGVLFFDNGPIIIDIHVLFFNVEDFILQFQDNNLLFFGLQLFNPSLLIYDLINMKSISLLLFFFRQSLIQLLGQLPHALLQSQVLLNHFCSIKLLHCRLCQ